MLASTRAHAELLRPGVPALTWGTAIHGWMPPQEGRFAPPLRSGIVWTPAFSALSIGVSEQTSFRSSMRVRFASLVSASANAPWKLCVGPNCPGRASSGTSPVDADGSRAMKAGSLRLINNLGPMAIAALGLFSSPRASETHPIAMRVSPMFALGGGGLEMKCAWW